MAALKKLYFCHPGYIYFNSSLSFTSPFIHPLLLGAILKILSSQTRSWISFAFIPGYSSLRATSVGWHFQLSFPIITHFTVFSSAGSLSSCCSHFSDLHSRGDSNQATERWKRSEQRQCLTTGAITLSTEQIYSRLALMFETWTLEVGWHMV